MVRTCSINLWHDKTYMRTDDKVDCATLSAKRLVLLMYKHLLTRSLTTTTWWHCLWLLYLCICCDVPSSLEWFYSFIKQVENLLFSVKHLKVLKSILAEKAWLILNWTRHYLTLRCLKMQILFANQLEMNLI